MIDKIKILRRVVLVYIEDFKNVCKYGLSAPKKYQLLYVVTEDIRFSFGGGEDRPIEEFGAVTSNGWSARKHSILESQRETVKNCLAAWGQGNKLRDSNEFARLMAKAKDNTDMEKYSKFVKARLDEVDEMLNEAKKEQALRTRHMINRFEFREKYGIGIAIDQDGEIIQYNEGHHRIAVAVHLGLPVIPVTVRAVHPRAIENGHWSAHRMRSISFEKEQKKPKFYRKICCALKGNWLVK